MKRFAVPSSLLYILAILGASCGAGSSNLTALTPASLILIGAAVLLGVMAARKEASEDARAKQLVEARA